MTDILNEQLSKKWGEERGLQVVSFGINTMTLPDDQRKKLEEMQQAVILSNANLAGGAVAAACADAMRTAAANEGEGGAMMGLGMGLAGMAGGNAQNLFQQGTAAASGTAGTSGGSCAPSPNGWTCECGALNKGKFCAECGKPKPAGAILYKCDKCGWEPADPENPPKFCSECGDLFDEKDIKK